MSFEQTKKMNKFFNLQARTSSTLDECLKKIDKATDRCNS